MTYDTEGSAAIDSRFDISDVISAVLSRVVIVEPIRRTTKPRKQRTRRKRRGAARATWRDDGSDPYER